MKYNLQIIPTSNPAIIKLQADKFLVKGHYEYQNIDQAKDAPLAQQLFYLPFIKTVYISSNFIALERYEIVQWEDVQQEVLESVERYLNSGAPVVNHQKENSSVPVSIYSESTPNPSVMKFVANKKLVPTVYEFQNIDQAKNAPLAKALFHFPFVKEVFFDDNYISITKYDIASWQDITAELRTFIQQFLREGHSVVDQQDYHHSTATPVQEVSKEDLDDTSKKIVDLLEEYVKPAVASDGGNIRFLSYDDKTHTVTVILQGACSGCPSSTITLKNGIETMLKQMLNNPEIKVEAFNG